MTETHPEKRLIGYARVSTYGQSLDSQLEQLRAAGCSNRNIYREKVTGARAPCCTDRGCRCTEPYPCSWLCDADVLRASQLQHSVQHADSDGYLACLSPVRLE